MGQQNNKAKRLLLKLRYSQSFTEPSSLDFFPNGSLSILEMIELLTISLKSLKL